MNADMVRAVNRKAILRETLRLALIFGAALTIGFLITCLTSHDPVHAYKALLTGALPEIRLNGEEGWTVYRMTRFGSVLQDAITLTLLGLSVAIAFHARQFSLGADGQLFLGALAAAAVSLAVPGPPVVVMPLALAASICAGFLYGLAPGALKARFGANEIVTTLMFNIIAVQLYRFIISRYMNDPAAGFIATPMLPDAALMHALIPRTNVTVMLFVAPIAAAIAWFLIMRTTIGYEIRLVGESMPFARQVGIPVRRAIALSMAIGGGFAGLAGFHVSNALLKRLPMDLTPGLGFDGIVVALLARNRPGQIPLVAFLYAYLRVGAQVMERTTDVSREVVMIIEAFIILFVVSERLGPVLAENWRCGLARIRSGVSKEAA
jgi:general nucleoside transport system permease protein